MGREREEPRGEVELREVQVEVGAGEDVSIVVGGGRRGGVVEDPVALQREGEGRGEVGGLEKNVAINHYCFRSRCLKTGGFHLSSFGTGDIF